VSESQRVVPSRIDPGVAIASTAIGGPLGIHARVGSHWLHPLRASVIVAVILYSLTVLWRWPCISSGFTGIERYTRMCYSDIPALYQARGFADGLRPYVDSAADIQPFEYPVLTGALAYLEAVLASGAGAVAFYAAHVLLSGLLLIVVVVSIGLAAAPRYWDAMLVATAPALLVTATINWDMLVVALVAVWLLLWSRGWAGWAGMVLGLAIAAKFYPLIFLGPMCVLAWRSGQWRPFLRMTIVAGMVWLIVNLPIALSHPQAWSYFYSFSSERGADLGSVWLALTIAGTPVADVNVVGVATFALLCLAIAGLIWFSPTLPRLAPMLFLTLAAFLVTNKVYSPQFVMWLVPLAVLSLPRLRPLLLWQAAELLYFAAVWFYLVDLEQPGEGLHPGWYATAIVIRVIALIWFSGLLIRFTLRPQHDPVRSTSPDTTSATPAKPLVL
jgi:uncharacterized membrane protein